jgi:hypothetical protein
VVWRRRSPEYARRDDRQLNKEINAGLADPTLKARFADIGGMVFPGSPSDFGKLISEETEKWGKAVEFAGIKPDEAGNLGSMFHISESTLSETTNIQGEGPFPVRPPGAGCAVSSRDAIKAQTPPRRLPA